MELSGIICNYLVPYETILDYWNFLVHDSFDGEPVHNMCKIVNDQQIMTISTEQDDLV